MGRSMQFFRTGFYPKSASTSIETLKVRGLSPLSGTEPKASKKKIASVPPSVGVGAHWFGHTIDLDYI